MCGCSGCVVVGVVLVYVVVRGGVAVVCVACVVVVDVREWW